MTVTRVARVNKRIRRCPGKCVNDFFLLIGLFHSPHPELNDGGGREGTTIGIYWKYAQRDDYASIWGNEGSARFENNSGHETLSAYVDSSELVLRQIPPYKIQGDMILSNACHWTTEFLSAKIL
jgi:hypothetical protein